VVHAEASARTVEAAVTAAAAQLGLRSDQVDVEVLEEPVPSTFGYIGTPARVRVTLRQPASAPTAAPSGDAPEAAEGSPVNGPGVAVTGRPSATPEAVAAGRPSDTIEVAARGPSEAMGGSVQGRPSDESQAAVPADASRPAQAVPADVPGSGKVSGPAPTPGDPAQAPEPGPAADLTGAADQPVAPGEYGAGFATQDPEASNQPEDPYPPATSEAPIDSTWTSEGEPHRSASEPARDSAPTGSSSAGPRDASGPAITRASLPAAPPSSAAGMAVSGHAMGAVLPGDSDPTRSQAGREPPGQSPTSARSSSLSATGGDQGPGLEGTAGVSTAAAASAMEKTPQESAASERSNATRSRRAHRDEPIDPEMVEADTERAGDFLEGLLDALDVDGDITTWIDEAGGHIELEGSDLNVLVGSNGETLDALQELTRIAVLRQSKRRVRLLLDINGFRSRQRDELTTVVKATAEQVIRSREDHEFQPMTPAERKIVHDAVAAIDGVQTESLGEEPYRRVVIRPA
jgi:spoIIIJ-associated protein